ncbi:MAG: acyl-ACP--UDP-N-acetylglucosamine O-acyltransferase [Chromatiales bacterium]|nr:acyl-ACP--UDP-N-acetylglucosamine O-acyltransferase [Chromatiales bacterium]
MKIHPTAIVDADAEIDPTAEIGAFTVVEAGVRIGPDCIIESHCRIYRGTHMGARNRVSFSVALGGPPQDLTHNAHADTFLEIGDDNVFREFCSVHRATEKDDGVTRIGSKSFFMGDTHVGHDCKVGNNVVLSHGASLSGHCRIDDQARLGGYCGLHQHVRVGQYAMIGGMAAVVQDVPPFALAVGNPARYLGLNQVGLRRAEFSRERRSAIRAAYKLLYGTGRPRAEVLAELLASADTDHQSIAEFFQSSRRGVMAAGRRGNDSDES